MSSYTIEKATPDDNEELCALFKIPLSGNIMLALERSPDFFAGSKIQCEEIETYVCRNKADKIVGVFSVGKRRVFYKKEIKSFRYFSDLRIHPDTQGSRLLYHIGRYITDNHILDEDIAQTIVFADNKVMMKLIAPLQHRSKKLSIFNYFPAGNYTSYMVKFSGNKLNESKKYQIKKAGEKYIPQMQEFLLAEGFKKEFFPYYDFHLLGDEYYAGLCIDNFYLAFENEELVGIAGIWDQHRIKQTKIYDYSFSYSLVRPFINLFNLLSNGFTLPARGTILKYLTIHSILTKNNDHRIFSQLLNTINGEYKKLTYNYFLIGLDEKDMLNKSLKNFVNKRAIKGRHFLVANKKTPENEILNSLYYLEAARI